MNDGTGFCTDTPINNDQEIEENIRLFLIRDKKIFFFFNFAVCNLNMSMLKKNRYRQNKRIFVIDVTTKFQLKEK